MTVKLIGSALILISSYVFGLMFSLNSRFFYEDMEEMKKAVMLYINEGLYYSKPLEVLFKEISERVTGAVSDIFSTAADIIYEKSESCGRDVFEKSIEINKKKLYFDSDGIECLYMFASNLDCLYKNQQEDAAKLIIENIKRLQKEINEKMKKERRLYSSCSILCGLMICILLL